MQPKYKDFADAYIQTLNASLSAIKAGYAPSNSADTGHELLRIPEIQKYIEDKRISISIQNEITVERVLKEVGRLAFSDPASYYDEAGKLKPFKDLTPDQTAAISHIVQTRNKKGKTVTKVKLYNKSAALVQLMKHLGLFAKDNEQSKPQILTQFNVEIIPPIDKAE